MSFWEVLILGVGLSMDAFAIAVCKGLAMKKLNVSQGFLIAFMFGLFQFLMPVIGYFFCSQFESYIKSFDHWIIFIILAFIGLKMIVDSIKEAKKESKKNIVKLSCKKGNDKINLTHDLIEENNNKIAKTEPTSQDDKNGLELMSSKINFKELVMLSIATSIDALAVGITLAFMDVNVIFATSIIGITTLVLCFIGVIIGNFFGEKFKRPAEITGGVILVLIAIKILLEHLGIILF
jgi:putative Mn2+ efflux pump MntP